MSWRERHRRHVMELEEAASHMMLTALGSILDQIADNLGVITAAAGDEAEARASLDDLSGITAQWTTAVDQVVLPWFGGVFEAGAAAAEEQVAGLGVVVPAPDPTLIDHAAAQYLAQARPRFFPLGEEAWNDARSELVAGFRAGEGIDALRRRVQQATQLSRAKAEAIARTEVIGAANMGADARVQLMGDQAPPYKQWLSTMDTRTRPTHVDADGQVVALQEQFQVGAAHLRVPGDPSGPPDEVIQCRCTTLYLETPEPLEVEGRQQGGPVDIVAAEGNVTPGRIPNLAAAAGPRQVDSTTGEEHTGAMLALVPEDPEAYTLEGGESPEILHLTLAYLGETADIPPAAAAAILAAAEHVAASTPPMEADVFGASLWNTSGDTPSLNLAVGGEGGPALETFHETVWGEIVRPAMGVDAWAPPANHAPWIPHMCVMYGDHEFGLEPFYASATAAAQLEGPIRFDRLRVALGAEAHDFTLGASPALAAAAVAATDSQEVPAVPWEIREGGDDCPFEVVKTDDGSRAGCHETREDAEEQVQALYAQEGDAAVDPTESPAVSGGPLPEPMPGEHLRAVMHVQGTPTGANDTGRVFTNTTYRETPFAFHWSRLAAAHGGQPVVVHVGNVVRVVPGAGPGVPDYGFVQLDLESSDGREYARRVVAGFERWVSIGLDETKAEVTMVWPDEDEDAAEGDELDLGKLFDEPDQVIIDGGRVAELTGVSTPAQADATLEPTPELVQLMDSPDDQETPVAASSAPTIRASHNGVRQRVAWDPSGRYNAVPAAGSSCGCGGSCGGCGTPEPTPADLVQAVTAAAHTITVPDLPPAEWFQEPTDVDLDGAFCVTDEGRIYGMLAPLGTGHRAYAKAGRRLEAPFGNIDYGRFMGAWALTQTGKVHAGPLTMDCGHAPILRANHDVAPEHYDNACSVIGSVAVGESRRLGGVWMAGALLPGVRPDQIARALACRCSGDWQPHPDKAGWQELIACLLVPSPGFGTAHPERPTTVFREGALVASSVPVRHVPDIARRPATPYAAAVAGVIDRAGRSPAARVLAALPGGHRPARPLPTPSSTD